MTLARIFRASAISVALATAAIAVSACGGKDANSAQVAAGPMPEGESWDGVYYHPVFGYLHLVEEDSGIHGRWKRADQSKWGELSGTVNGNLVHYTWTEYTIGGLGPASQTKGKGYFVYKLDKEGHAVLDGQFGLNDEETGSDWHNVKQTNMKPDLKSINGSDPDAPSTGGGF